jgi:fluoroquinolone resistance protein
MGTGKQAKVSCEVQFSADDSATLDFDGAQFEDCKFDHCSLRGRDLRGSRFLDCTFVTCDLVVAQMTNCVFSRVRFQDCRLSGINWSLASKLEFVSFDSCQLNDGSFLGLQLAGCAFTDCMARGTSFRDTNLAKVSFRGSDLSMAEFVNCDLRGADFRGALNYVLSPADNRLEKARFSLPEAMNLLKGLGIILD